MTGGSSPAMVHPYEVARRQFAAVVRDADPESVVPACPGWTVHELLAHQVHQLSGALDGSLPVADAIDRLSGTDASERQAAAERQEAWIARGVADWRARSTGQLLLTWAELNDTAPPEVLDALVADVVVHLLDLQGAVGSHESRDDALVSKALEFWSSMADVAMPQSADQRYELLRVITGRRSRSQAPGVEEAVALYGWREDDLIE